jgi:glyoxylase-like metal-dependent hydrolase (beta-lactamase superfamily II)
VLICGDYLSPVEIPTPEASIDAYLATLDRLVPLVTRAAHVVVGHGGVLGSEAALSVLREDRDYLQALRREGAAAALPPGRLDREQRRLHATNVARLAKVAGP